MASSAIGKLSREEYRRQKDLDAARKAGTAPAELDQEGRAINPHIPQYISQAPWYLDTGKPSLSHQRRAEIKEAEDKLDRWYDRGRTTGPAATKYRKGACENCGALTHKKQDCLERPRKKGARFTGKDIAPDEAIQDVEAGYAAKRDRWNGYDPKEHSKIYDEYAAVEEARQKLREEEIDKRTMTDLAAVRKVAKVKGEGDKGDPDFGSSDEEDADEEKYADAADAVGQKLDTKTRITVRNLRIREDTAKYLINLDPESAYYDPKTRSMRDAPEKNVALEDAKFAGDNFLRSSGDAPAVQKLQLFAWQSSERGNDIHLNSNPTQGEILHKQYKENTEKLRDTSKVSILAKYGGEEYLSTVPKELLQGQTENYVEYSRAGQIIKGKERIKARSKYAEDVYINNHTSVWGSWYSVASGEWGYACCHSTTHASYCSGKAGIEAAEASSAQILLAAAAKPVQLSSETQRGGEENQKRKTGDEVATEAESKKRKYNNDFTSESYEVSEEQMEEYRRTKRAGMEDPMYNYKDTDDLL